MSLITQAINPGNKNRIPLQSQRGTARFSEEIFNDLD